jgi:hypothetical protein
MEEVYNADHITIRFQFYLSLYHSFLYQFILSCIIIIHPSSIYRLFHFLNNDFSLIENSIKFIEKGNAIPFLLSLLLSLFIIVIILLFIIALHIRY